MEFDLAFIWAGLIALSVLIYVVLDGFDLGLGILFPLAKSHKERDLMMNSVAPVWDGIAVAEQALFVSGTDGMLYRLQ